MKNEMVRDVIAGVVIALLGALMVAGMIRYPNTEPCTPQTRAASRCVVVPTHVESDASDGPISVSKDGNR